MEVSIPSYMTEFNEFIKTTSTSNSHFADVLTKHIKEKQLDCSDILYWIAIQITRDISAMSANSDILNLRKLINAFKILKQRKGKSTQFIDLDQAKEIFLSLIEKVNGILIQFTATQSNLESQSSEAKTKELIDLQTNQMSKLKFSEFKIQAITLFIIEFYSIYPFEFAQILSKSSIIFNELLHCFSNNYIMREFIYLYVSCNYNNSFSIFKDKIEKVFVNVKDLLQTQQYDILVKELISIAQLFLNDFNSILMDYYEIINEFLVKYKPHKYDTIIQLLFKELTELSRKEVENDSYEIFNLMMRLYDQHLDNEEIGKAIIYHCFNQITLDQYRLLINNSLLIDKYIKQLYKQTNQEIVSYFLEWIKQFSFDTEVFDEFIPNKEFELIIGNFLYFDNNIPILLFIHKEIKIILQKETYAQLFINDPQLFKIIKGIVDNKGPTAKHFLKFIEELLDLNLYRAIFDKANEVKLFSFDTFMYHDEVRYQVIKLSLFFEDNEELFQIRTQENIEGLFKLLNQIKNTEGEGNDNDKHYVDNCEEIIEVLNIILDSLSKGRTNIYNRVDITVFEIILKLINEFTVTLIESEKQMKYIFCLWSHLFKFISNINKLLMIQKLQPEETCHLINKTPQFMTQAIIETFISNGLLKYKNERRQVFLRYLYEKCINFTMNDDKFTPIDSIYDPIHCLKLKYPNTKQIESKFQQKETEIESHSLVFVQSQMILQCIMNVVLELDIDDIKISFIDYIDYLCSISQFNASLIIQTGLMDKLTEIIISSQIKNETIVSLLVKILIYASKSDLEHYFKQLYNQLIIKHNIDNAVYLLNILHKSLQSARKRNYITLSKLSTHHPQTYKFIYMNRSLTSSINIFISLYTESFSCLYNFTLCKISRKEVSFSIELSKCKVLFLKNKTPQFSIPLNPDSKQLKRKWYNFLIEKGENYNTSFSKDIFIITIPDIIESEIIRNEEDNEEQCLDFSMGYINLSTSETIEKKNTIETVYVDVSYILLSKEKLTNDLINKIDSNNICTSKNGSVMQFMLQFTPNNIITEVLFSKINLAKVEHNVLYILTNQFNFDLISTQVIPTIVCNDTRNHDNLLYLLKPLNLIDYASMNMICDNNTFTKSAIVSQLFPYFTSIETSINNIYFADMFYILLSQTDYFIQLYKPTINIILNHLAFQNTFITTYIHELKMLFYFHSSELKSDFSELLTIHNIIPIRDDIQDDCIIDIYLDPYLFTSLPFVVEKQLLKKINLIANNYNSGAQELHYSKIRKILKQLMNLMVFFEVDCNLVGAIKEIIDEIFNVFINESGIELDITLSLAKNYLLIISNFFKNKQQINHSVSLRNFDIENIQSQMDMLESYLKSSLDNKNSNSILTEDIDYIAELFKIEFYFFKQSLQFDKRNKHINKNLRLLWPEYYNDYRHYTWMLSDREGYSRMRKKLVLKENDMVIKEAKETKYDILSSKIEEYMKYWVWFERFSAYDSHSPTLLVQYMVNPKDKYQNSYFSLLFKNNEPIESLLIIGEKAIYIYYNIIIDKNKKIYVSKIQTSNLFWARDNNEKEWETLFQSNETKQSTINEFNYQSSQIRFKLIPFTQISELHKRRHLHQNNSLELFTLKGSSYFITVFPKYRDEVFNKILMNINDQSTNSRIKNINKASSQNAIYLKHYPIVISSIKDKDKENALMEKSVVDGKNLVSDIAEKWAQYSIPSFNYLMLVNTVAGRSYNDLTQYFVFPWMIKNFFSNNIDINSDDLYRDFAFPLHAQCKDDRENKRRNYEMKVQDEKLAKDQFDKKQAENKKSGLITKIIKYEAFPIFHSGNYYSNFSFVCYFMLRLSPFSSIGLSVRGTFSQGDRLFNTYESISSISKRYQEWIPELFYLPEMLMNINDYELGTMTTKNSKKDVNDIIVPPWAHFDPRLVPLEFNRILEKGKVSDQLSNWIDLVFGYKLVGKDCIEAINMFNDICYPYEDLKEKKMSNEELLGRLDSTSNLGCCPIQIFSKPHTQRKVFNPGKLIPFYEVNSILFSIQPQKSIKQCELKSKTIGDMKAINETPKFNISKGEGGLSSFRFTTDVFCEDSFDRDAKVKRNYFVVGKNKCLLGPKFSILLSYSVSSIYITNPINSVIYHFPLNEHSPINKVICSISGKSIVVGLSNGNVIKYRKRTKHNEILNFPFMEISKVKTSKINVSPEHNKIGIDVPSLFFNYRDLSFKSFDYWESFPNPPSAKNPLKKSLKVYALIEENRSGIPTGSISKMDLCESYSFLLVIDCFNNVYQYDFNLLKLLYHYQFNHISNTNYSIKYAKIIHKTGDYLIGTKYSIYLFSINGIPLAYLNMFDQDIQNKSPITACEAVALDDTYVFTGHSNGNLMLWKIKTEDNQIKSDDQPLFEVFHQRYRNSFKEKRYTDNIFHQRRFELKNVYKRKHNEDEEVKIIFIKLSDDLLRLYYIDEEMNILRLSSDAYFKDEDGFKLKKNNTVQYQNKIICKTCKKSLNYEWSNQNDNDVCECSNSFGSKFKTFD